MSIESIPMLLHKAKDEVLHHQYAAALKIIRDAKIIDIQNIYLSTLEQFVAKLVLPSSAESVDDTAAENEQMLMILVDRSLKDTERRSVNRTHGISVPDERTLLQEKIKNQYFQRADEFIEKKEYGRALEEIRRIYFFDPLNFVAKEYEQKIVQLAELNKK